MSNSAQSQGFIDAARQNAEVAEAYARITLESQRLQKAAPGIDQKQAIQQALTTLYGDKASQVAEEIARAADAKHAFDAGERVHQAREALGKISKLSNVTFAKPARGDHSQDALLDIERSRHATAHPEKTGDPLKHEELADTAREAQKPVAQKINTLDTILDDPKNPRKLTREERGAVKKVISTLQAAQHDLAQTSTPTKPTELSAQDVQDAMQLKEIEAGRNAKAITGPDRNIPAVQKMVKRADALAHVDPAAPPGVLERAQAGIPPLSRQLPAPAAAPTAAAQAPHTTTLPAAAPIAPADTAPATEPPAVNSHNSGDWLDAPKPRVSNGSPATTAMPGSKAAPTTPVAANDSDVEMRPQLQQQAQRQHTPSADTVSKQTAQQQVQALQPPANSGPTSPPPAPQPPLEAQAPPTPPTTATPSPSQPITVSHEVGGATPPPPVETMEALSAAGKLAKAAGPALLAAGPVLNAGMQGYQAYAQGKGAGGVALATGHGALAGAVDTIAPGARTGYADVIGSKGKDLSVVDRILNGASDATQSVAVTASGVTLAGVESGPLDIAPAAVAAVSGIANIGVNLAKAGLKVTGLAGKDQDAGYIYDGVALGVHLAEAGVDKIRHLFGGAAAADVTVAPHEVPPQPPAAGRSDAESISR